MTTHQPAWAEVDLGAIRRNAERLRARARVPIIAMVKADAYGLGVVPVAQARGAAFGSDTIARSPTEALWALGVSRLDEAKELRAAGCSARIVCCAPLLADELPEAAELKLRPSLHHVEDIAVWRSIGGGPWHFSVDTGMSRAGTSWRELLANVAPIGAAIADCQPEGIFTHFHSADVGDGSLRQQQERFAAACLALQAALPLGVLVHSDNSAAIAARTSGSPGHLARPGIALYGACEVLRLGLEQTVHLRARVVDVRTIEAGESVSYLATWTAPSVRRIATVPLGYGDGYRQQLANRGEGLIGGRRCAVVGRVTMDLTMLDVTDVPCDVGTVVTLIGRDGDTLLSTDTVAERSGVSPYELLVGLRLRVPRRYTGERDGFA